MQSSDPTSTDLNTLRIILYDSFLQILMKIHFARPQLLSVHSNEQAIMHVVSEPYLSPFHIQFVLFLFACIHCLINDP